MSVDMVSDLKRDIMLHRSKLQTFIGAAIELFNIGTISWFYSYGSAFC